MVVGPCLTPPSYHESRVVLLKKEVENPNVMMKDHKEAWKKYECTIMSDGWKDRANSLVNVLVNCPKRSMLIESIDAPSVSKPA